MMRFSPRRTLTFLALGVLSGLTACADDPIAPTTPPTEPPTAHGGRVLGLVEVTLSGLGTGAVHASARPVAPGLPSTTASGVHLSLSPVPGGDGSIELDPLSTGSFTDGERGSGGQRYLYATFRVRNAQEDGTAYTDARTNLTFLAVSTAGTLNETAISTLKRFDGSPADPAIAPEILPTGAVTRNTISGQPMATSPDVLQLLTEPEAAAITAPAGVRSVFPYGFVVRNPATSDSRTLPASPAAGQFDGVVTFAFKVPLQASPAADPFTMSVMFLAVDDDQTVVTQSLEEQNATAQAILEARAGALGAIGLTLLPGGSAFLGVGAERVICAVRVAGPAGSPTAMFAPPSTGEPLLLPSAGHTAASILPRTARVAAARCPSIPAADARSFALQGFQSGRPSGAYPGVGTSLVRTPAAPGGDFFPGEEIEVTLTTALGGSRPVVARYRVAASGGSGSLTAVSTPAVGSGPVSVTAADLDGDGDVDLAVANVLANSVSILKNP